MDVGVLVALDDDDSDRLNDVSAVLNVVIPIVDSDNSIAVVISVRVVGKLCVTSLVDDAEINQNAFMLTNEIKAMH